MYTLAMDTSNQVLGVAILKENQVIGEVVTNIAKNHSVRLMPAIDNLMDEVGVKPEQLGKIVVAKGPGSYTGVRIGVTTAKTMAWALNIPVVGVSSLEVLAYHGRFYHSMICPFFDARRDMVYTGLYQWKSGKLEYVFDEQNILMSDWLELLAQKKQEVLFLSPDMAKHKNKIVEHLGELAIIPEDTYQIAKPSLLALAGYNKKSDPTHELTPNYLRMAEAEANWLKSQKEQKKNG